MLEGGTAPYSIAVKMDACSAALHLCNCGMAVKHHEMRGHKREVFRGKAIYSACA